MPWNCPRKTMRINPFKRKKPNVFMSWCSLFCDGQEAVGYCVTSDGIEYLVCQDCFDELASGRDPQNSPHVIDS